MTGAALHLARLGVAVLPLEPRGKRPHPRLAPHGLKDATTDPTRLAAWWEAEPQANIGALPPAGVLVLDLDDPDAWGRLVAAHPELDAAPRAQTGSGGWHVWCKLPEGVTLPTKARALPAYSLDVRGLGRAYVVAPPSVHPSGWRYEWLAPLVGLDALPPLPGELLERLAPKRPELRPHPIVAESNPDRTRRYALAALEAEVTEVAATPEGGRNCAVNRAAFALGGLVAMGALSEEEVVGALLQAARAAGLPEREAWAAIRSGLGAGVAHPRHLPPNTQFAAKGLAEKQTRCSSQKVDFTPLSHNQWGGPSVWREKGGW